MNRLLTLALLALLLLACKKDKASDPTPAQPQLPPATQTGANTFGCYVNGKPFTSPDRYRIFQMKPGAYLMDWQTFTDTTWWIHVSLPGNPTPLEHPSNYFVAGVAVFLPYPPEVGKRYRAITLPWTEWGGGGVDLTLADRSGLIGAETQPGVDTGWVEVCRFDLESRVVSGRFEFSASRFSDHRVDKVHVKNGWFDCKFYN